MEARLLGFIVLDVIMVCGLIGYIPLSSRFVMKVKYEKVPMEATCCSELPSRELWQGRLPGLVVAQNVLCAVRFTANFIPGQMRCGKGGVGLHATPSCHYEVYD